MYVAENGRPAIQSVNDAIERMQTHQDIHYALLNVRSAEYGAFGGCDESVDYEDMRRNLENLQIQLSILPRIIRINKMNWEK